MKPIMRREFLKRLAALSVMAVAPPSRAAEPILSRAEGHRLLRQGRTALILRHGLTEPGVGDPPGFTLNACATQRNLSAEGKRELGNIAIRNKQADVVFARAYTSQWCRTRDTAALLAPAGVKVLDFPPLNSSFGDNVVAPDAREQILELLTALPAKQSWLLVTHQVNIAALVGGSPAPGEGAVVRMGATGLTLLGWVRL